MRFCGILRSGQGARKGGRHVSRTKPRQAKGDGAKQPQAVYRVSRTKLRRAKTCCHTIKTARTGDRFASRQNGIATEQKRLGTRQAAIGKATLGIAHAPDEFDAILPMPKKRQGLWRARGRQGAHPSRFRDRRPIPSSMLDNMTAFLSNILDSYATLSDRNVMQFRYSLRFCNYSH